MTDVKDDVQIANKIVATLDICSSSRIIEDLLKTNNVQIWRDLIIRIKEYLSENAPICGAEVHKFIGDGWILLFDKPYSGKRVLQLLSGVSKHYEELYDSLVYNSLDSPPEIRGLTIGVDEGQLIRVTMQEKDEYVGRPINVACRLQGIINETDIKSGYSVFMSHRLFHILKADFGDYRFAETERPLRNIGEGKNFKCYRIALSNTEFRILDARYGTDSNNINVTFQYTKQINNGRLDVVVSNTIAENDPDYGVPKTRKIRFVSKGIVQEKEVKEGSRIQIP